MDFLTVVASVQVEITRPGEETGSALLVADGVDQRVHAPNPTAHRLTSIMRNQLFCAVDD
jgi:hypothetical protein